MVNRDFMCMIWFGFIKWTTTKDMMDGKYVIDRIYSIMSTNILMRKTQDIYHVEHRLPLWNMIVEDTRQ